MVLDMDRNVLWVFKNNLFHFLFQGVEGKLFLSFTMDKGDSYILLSHSEKEIRSSLGASVQLLEKSIESVQEIVKWD
jgi:hypothetical protein